MLCVTQMVVFIVECKAIISPTHLRGNKLITLCFTFYHLKFAIFIKALSETPILLYGDVSSCQRHYDHTTCF